MTSSSRLSVLGQMRGESMNIVGPRTRSLPVAFSSFHSPYPAGVDNPRVSWKDVSGFDRRERGGALTAVTCSYFCLIALNLPLCKHLVRDARKRNALFLVLHTRRSMCHLGYGKLLRSTSRQVAMNFLTLEGSGFSPLILRDADTLIGMRWTSSAGGFCESIVRRVVVRTEIKGVPG